jgi:hypothetical protein
MAAEDWKDRSSAFTVHLFFFFLLIYIVGWDMTSRFSLHASICNQTWAPPISTIRNSIPPRKWLI